MLSVSIVAKWVHILLATLAFSVLCLAALQAALLAMQEKQLHHKRLTGLIQTLPPLQTMETWLFRLVSFGFILLSGLLLTSTLFFEMTPQLLQKTVVSLIAWGIFAGLLLGRYYFGWRGKVAIRATMGGVILLILIYVGSVLFWGKQF